MNTAARRMRAQVGAHADSIVTLVVVAFTCLALVMDWSEGDSDPNAFASTIAILAAAAVWFRRQNPIAILLAVGVAHLFVTWNTGNEHALVGAAVVALFSVSRVGDRKLGLSVAAVIGLAMAVGIAAFDTDRFLPEFIGEAALMAVPIAIGDSVRSRADRLRDLIDTEANSRVQAERIRIARDLHDVVAHGLSTIAIQSGVAAHLIDSNPDADLNHHLNQAKEALEAINLTGKRSLEELRAMVGVLRSTDEVPLLPTPTDPNNFADLLDRAASAGIDVTTEITGAFPTDVGDGCVVALHRIIQEALTNVARHAGAVATTLQIAHGTEQVEVLISNARGVPASTAPDVDTTREATGVGIVGMQERAESLGGNLTAEPTSTGGFLVTALLPYRVSRENIR